ncbi:hypothetical protein L3X38_024651 [Prunus dulcis]|uniref:Uncharacterized protein n=1 Tax=Prunus dulcis TaxID=3755 RepID=A0AAD4W0A5_PRUDU|nr:hypothetical protein L3X38_024651 [Prunus dulcis]
MVTKQSWRLRENPSSLVARILKARYFPHANFLDAMLGSSPSLDKWIPKPITFRPLLSKGLNGEAMVADLIMPSRKWDLQLLEQALCAEDCEVVSSISLGTVAQLDDNFLEFAFHNFSCVELEQFVVCLWSVWHMRNEVVHGKIVEPVEMLVEKAMEGHATFKVCNAKPNRRSCVYPVTLAGSSHLHTPYPQL